MLPQHVNILLVDDQEDDYVIFRDIAEQITHLTTRIDWAETIDAGLACLNQKTYDICFVDYRLRLQTGLDFLQAMQKAGRQDACPVIILTGKGDYDIDIRVMRKGASDYIEKGLLTPLLLERAIRYAIERMRHIRALKRSARRLRTMSAKLIHAQENERKKIARDLHDNIGSNLTAIKFGLENVLRLYGSPDAENDPLQDMVSLLKRSISELRNIYSEIRPAMLDDLGLIKTLQWYCRRIGMLSPEIQIDLRVAVKEPEMPDELKIVVFRILQEALSNTTKYARADRVAVGLEKRNGQLVFEVRDNGIGFDLETAMEEADCDNCGMGLENMRERAEFFGGMFQVNSREGEGTTISASWDLTAEVFREAAVVEASEH